MTTGSFAWFLIFAVCAGLFFGIALFVTFHGAGELHDLLRSARQKKGRT